MLDILTIVLPVFLVVAAGYGATRFGGFAQSAVDGLTAFAVRFAVPTLLFGAMARLDLAQAFDPGLMAAFYLGVGLCFLLGVRGARGLFGRRPGEAVAIGFAAMFSNTLLLGVPIIARAYDDATLAAAFTIVALHAPFNYVLGIVTMELSRRDGAPPLETARSAARAIFSNALTLGIVAGLAVNLYGAGLPEAVWGAVDLVTDAALPSALFGLGGALTRYRLRADLGEAGLIAGLSLIVHPALTLLLGWLFGLPAAMLQAGVMLAAMPTGMNGYVFAAQYRRAEGAAASGLLLGAALAPLTVSAWLWALG